MTKKAILIVAFLLLAAALGWLYLGATAISTVFGSRHAYRPSPDANGKIALRLHFSNTGDVSKVSTWELKIPEEYLKFVLGDMNNIGPSEFSSMFIFGKVEDLVSSPVLTSAKDQYQPAISFGHLENRLANPKVIEFGGCLSTLESTPGLLEGAHLRTCDTPNCQIYDHIDGWSVDYSVPRKNALDPVPVCNAFRQFLNTYTINRDNVLN
jgi:hypothetical protein